MNTKNLALITVILSIPFGFVGYLASGLGGAKLGLAVLLMFAVTVWIIAYSLRKIES